MARPPRVLYAILNWGLGHATRSIPVIQELLKQGAQVVVASDGAALTYIRTTFRQLETVALPSYHIRYASSSMVWEMGRSLPRIFRAIQAEKQVSASMIRQYKIDRIISDNRYGCYHENIPGVLLIHQLALRCPQKLRWMEPVLFRLHKKRIEKFDACWVPDVEGAENLSGELSHGCQLKNIQFIGWLSHLDPEKKTSAENIPLLIVCSGPEPARTAFENKMTDELIRCKQQAVLVRGSHQPMKVNPPREIMVFDMCNSRQLADLMLHAQVIISRSGYSTIMDLVKMSKPAILIPTPGQTEQEYLAAYHKSAGRFYAVAEKDFSLKTALSEYVHYRNNLIFNNRQLESAVRDFLG